MAVTSTSGGSVAAGEIAPTNGTRLEHAQPRPTAPDLSHNKWAVSLAVIFGVLMSAIDSSVVNVALPEIQGNTGATQQEITWISTSYMISVVILMPLTNWLATRFGRKRVYMLSLVIFTASSVMCGMSHTLNELILWRSVQGLGAGTLQPLAMAMFREAFPPNEQGVAMGVFGFVVLAGPAIGPTLGGWITDNYNWPWIFFINLPIGIIGFMVASRVLQPDHPEPGTKQVKVDATGITLLAIGLAAMQTVLEEGQIKDWFDSSFITVATIIAAIALVAFVYWELKTDSPAVDLRILTNPQFLAGTIIGGLLGVGLFASLFLLPQFFQTLLGVDATQSGLALMPRSLAMMVAMPIGGILYNKLGPRVLIVSGLIMSVWTQIVFAQSTDLTSASGLVWPLIVQGLGIAFVFVAMSTASLATIPRAKMTSATGLNNLIRQLGGSIGTAVVVNVLVSHKDAARSALVGNISSSNPVAMDRINMMAHYFMGQGASASGAHALALGMISGSIDRQAATLAYDYMFAWIGIMFALCVPIAFLLKAAKQGTPAAPVHAAAD